ncbi:uncharacterized membrane protein YhaH (DUF805 family) [Orbus hercynius]|uniref:Uncharacterized membrane protein YhaH (DUF805 family) n=1 Tax=Orbus hercynius TaxID=593135 RepID=A0A495RF49_9GAMM|nr:DUF805 domain-containing protein [Orbus hercynius]RKS86015.1 uncharacterized membrane protein YhaH (DUF805 family) [Orbus hercynius]
MDWYLKCIKDNYANFNGRARRKEFWMFTLFNWIVIFVLMILAGIFGSFSHSLASIVVFIYFIFAAAVIIPTIAVTVRRLHDTGRSGWWYLIIFVPIVGPIILLVFMFLDSMPIENQYGLNPKA